MMVKRFRLLLHSYPNQFWLMFVGMLISTVGASMIWPFLMIYVSKRLNAPMTLAASLLTLNAAMGLIASFLGGPLLDRIGRKWIMVFSLAANGAAYIFLGHASAFPQFALLLGITGAVNPLYRSGADTMMADLVPPERRADAYSLMRLSNNLGISVGPLIGGFIASTSYTLAFYCAAAGMMLYSLLMMLLGKETMPARPTAEVDSTLKREAFGGYPAILRDGRFMSFIATFTLVSVCAVLMWTIMPVYANRNFQVPENVYKWIPATNAMMVVFFQQLVTQITKRYAPLRALAAGALFYAVAAGGVALATHFWGFWVCMVVMTIGELILAPTSSTYAANLAPSDKRGRYMSLYGLTWPVGAGVGPIFGGLLNDLLGPQATWYGGMVVGLIGALIFALLGRHISSMQGLTTPTSAAD